MPQNSERRYGKPATGYKKYPAKSGSAGGAGTRSGSGSGTGAGGTGYRSDSSRSSGTGYRSENSRSSGTGYRSENGRGSGTGYRGGNGPKNIDKPAYRPRPEWKDKSAKESVEAVAEKPEVVSDKPETISAADESGVIEGRNAVTEALKAGVQVDKLFVRKEEGQGHDAILGRIISMAREQGAAVVECDRRMLDRMSVTKAHQGVIAHAAAAEYVEVSDLIASAKESGPNPIIVICDNLNDPGNLGAVIRVAHVAGACGIVIPRRRSAGLTPSVAKAAAGALAYIPVARCANLAAAIDELKEAGFWIFAAEADGESMYKCDMVRPMALVIGSEGEGVGRLVREKCDYVVSIPMFGKINSLNASSAASVMLYEAVRQRVTKVETAKA